ncbi:hypothetical protein Tco_0454647 [Tanacetum coccineum]
MKLLPSYHPNIKALEIGDEILLGKSAIFKRTRRANSGMPPKRASTTEAPAMTQDAIRKLVAESVTSALEAQALRTQWQV